MMHTGEVLKPDFRRTHLVLLELGVPVQNYYREFGIQERHYREPNQPIPKHRHMDLLSRIAEGENRPFLGVEMGHEPRTNDLGVLSYMIRNAPTFRKSIELIGSYMDLIAPGASASLITEGDSCIWTYSAGNFTPDQCRHDVESTLVQFCEMVRAMVEDESWQPECAYLQHHRPENITPLEQYLCPTLHFDSPRNGVRFPSRLLHHTINDADLDLLEILEKQVRSSLDTMNKSNDLADRVAFLLSSRLGKADVSADAIASELAMTRRTLVRKLSRQGRHFKEIKDAIMVSMAKEILSATAASVTEAAFQLGFSEPSAFHRFFKRMTGLSPSQYKVRQSR